MIETLTRERPRLAALLRLRLARYCVASATGTVVDLTLFATFLALGMIAPLGAAIAYLLGTCAHWMVTSRIVFHDRLAEVGMARRGQQLGFFLTAFLGLAITTGVVWAGVDAGLDARLAKLAAMLMSFAVVWLLRLFVVFRESKRAAR